MKGVASDKGVKIRKMEQKRLKQTEEIKEEKQERVKEKSKKARRQKRVWKNSVKRNLSRYRKN